MSLQRVKWLTAKVSLSIDEIYRLLIAHPYSEKEGLGFDIEDVSSYRLLGDFYSKSVVVSKVFDPFGRAIETEVVNYIKHSFEMIELSSGCFLLTLHNSPQSSKPFLMYISKLLGDKFYMSHLTFNLVAFINDLREIYSKKIFLVNKLKLNGVVISDNSKAAVEIISNRDAFIDAKTFLESRRYEIERVRFAMRDEGVNISCEVINSGSAVVSEEFLPKLMEYVLSLHRVSNPEIFPIR
jgi:hypothetical protein